MANSNEKFEKLQISCDKKYKKIKLKRDFVGIVMGVFGGKKS
jgi:hypothetical protein